MSVCQNNLISKSASSYDKKDKHFTPISSHYLNIHDSQNVENHEKDDSNPINKSTFSLHISAYENGNKDANDEKIFSNKFVPKKVNEKMSKDAKQLVFCSNSKDLFGIPRQQKEEVSEPENMQFKASQKLLDPNQQKSFNKCKDEANKLFKAEKYEECLAAYNQMIIQFGDRLNVQQRAILYSNRSATYLMLNEGDFTKMAKSDAELVIKLWPSWWRGYYRLGRIHEVQEEWKEAEKSFEKAFALNPESKETRDELSAVRAKIGYLSRSDHLNPGILNKDEFKEIVARLGLTEDDINKLGKFALNIPGIGDILHGNSYRDGNGVEKDYKKAFECYMKAAEKDISEAMFNLGTMYQNGLGVKRDYKESMKWLLKAAAAKPFGMESYKKNHFNSFKDFLKGSGVAEAQHLIALNYSEGVGVDKDYKKAAEWYEKAVANGFAPSANNLGLLYQEGLGVEKSATKAFQYFKFAAQRGEISSMVNLANCYFNFDGTGSTNLTKEDVEEGMKWLRLAAEKGDSKAAEQLQKREDLPIKNLFLETMRSFMYRDLFEKRNPLNYEEFGKYIEEAAAKGSKTAQRHMDIWKNFDDALKAFKKNDSGGVVSALSKAIHLDLQIAKIPELFKAMIEERYKSHPNELNAIVCYIQINTKELRTSTIIFNALKMYPSDEYLAEMAYSYHTVVNENEAALKCAELALTLHPNSLRLLYIYAVSLTQQEGQPSECVKALDHFLAVAPKDNDKVPACHYRKAMYYNYIQDFPNFIASFEAGLAAEKEQLPCFLPYFFKAKTILEKLYMIKKKEQPNPGLSEKASMSPRFEQIKHDVQRKILLRKNRELFISLFEPNTKPKLCDTPALQPNTSKPPPLKNLKKIMLKEMDPKTDKVYDGFVLQAQIIDWTIPSIDSNGISTIIEDKNGDVHRLTVYNWPLTGDKKVDIPKAIKDFYPNSKVTIINPHLRLAMNGSNVITVESPEFIQIDKTSTDQRCHCCRKEAKILSCSGCMMAKYCSKECQKLDWIEFNHKGICKHIKSFAKMM